MPVLPLKIHLGDIVQAKAYGVPLQQHLQPIVEQAKRANPDATFEIVFHNSMAIMEFGPGIIAEACAAVNNLLASPPLPIPVPMPPPFGDAPPPKPED